MLSALYGGKFHPEDETLMERKIAYFTQFVNPAASAWGFQTAVSEREYTETCRLWIWQIFVVSTNRQGTVFPDNSISLF
jgi:hypothetical protein